MPPKKRKVQQADIQPPAVAAPNKKLKPRKQVTETAATSRPRRGSANEGDVTNATKATKAKKSTALTKASKKSAKKSVAPKSLDPPQRKGRFPTNDQDAEPRRTSTASVEVPILQHSESEKDPDDGASETSSFWLMKAEPESRMEKGKDVKFSIDDLQAATKPEGWDGVRNLSARNNMRAMHEGDLAFFYHSNCKVPGIAGIMEVVQEHSVDESAFDPEHPYYDAKSIRENPKWSLVYVEFRYKFANLISLKELQKFAKPGGTLEHMQTLKMSRLSVSKVTKEEWDFIMGLADEDDDAEALAVLNDRPIKQKQEKLNRTESAAPKSKPSLLKEEHAEEKQPKTEPDQVHAKNAAAKDSASETPDGEGTKPASS